MILKNHNKINEIKEKLLNYWKNLSKRDKIIIAVMLFILPSFLYFRFYFFPTTGKIKKLKKEKTNLEIKLHNIQFNKAFSKKLEKEIEKKELILKKAQKLLPTSNEIPELLTSISKEATKSGLKILSFQPKNEIKEDYYAKIPIEIKVEGPFHQIMMFIDNIRRLERIVITKKIVFYNPKEQENQWIVTADCSLETFRFLTEQEQNEQKQKQKKKK